MFFIWTGGRESLRTFLDDFNKLYSNPTFTHESSEQSVSFLHFKANLIDESITNDLRLYTLARIYTLASNV